MLDAYRHFLMTMTAGFVPEAWQVQLVDVLLIMTQITIILVPLMLSVAYMVYAERKIIGYIQGRIGPNRVGAFGYHLAGLGQPIADALKLILKEIVVPSGASKILFIIAPILSMGPAVAAWAVVPFADGVVLADINAGLLYVLALTSLAVYGVIIAGWASNSKYAFLGAMRSAAQIVAYEISMGFALVGVVVAAGSLNLGSIIEGQSGSIVHWYWLPLLPFFLVYFISGVAETNRAPFDVAEGESEIVAGFHVEYSGMAFSLFFLAEYANIILISVLTAIFFLGGWLSPFQGILPESAFSLPVIGTMLSGGLHWLLFKTAFFIFVFLWLRATFPRYRYDQIMRLGWKVFIPITLVWLVVVAFMVKLQLPWWFN